MVGLHDFALIAASFIAGLVFLPVLTRIWEPDKVHRFFDALGRAVAAPFLLLARPFSKDRERQKTPFAEAAGEARGDARERRINDSVQTIRSMLMVLAAAMERTEQAATDSSHSLTEARVALKSMGLPPELTATASRLVTQIDRVVDSNSSLKGELANSQKVLDNQQQLIESLRTAVRIDSMTQLANRTHFDEKLAELLKAEQRSGESFFLMLVDVDNFKAINDSYGHQAGDRILKGVAFKLKSALRETDFVARFGGDEFALIVIKTTAQLATRLAWKLCETLRTSRFHLDGNEITVTISIGAAESAAGDTPQTLISRADQALYQVKEGGRDGVKFASP